MAKVLTFVLAQKQFVPQCKDFPTQNEWSILQLKNYRMVHAMVSCTADIPDLVTDRKLTGVCDSDAQHVTWYLNRSQEFMKPLQLDRILQIEINTENLSKLLHICSYSYVPHFWYNFCRFHIFSSEDVSHIICNLHVFY